MRKVVFAAAMAAAAPMALGLLAVGAASAQTAPDYATLDADGDGNVTLAEVKTALPDRSDDQLIAADADGDGNLSADEYAALTAS